MEELKKKFNKLVWKKAPNGNPNIPSTVQETNAIRLLTIETTKGVCGLEDKAFAADDDNQSEDKEEDREDEAVAI